MKVRIEILIERDGDISKRGREEIVEVITEGVESLSRLGRVTSNVFINGAWAGATAARGNAAI